MIFKENEDIEVATNKRQDELRIINTSDEEIEESNPGEWLNLSLGGNSLSSVGDNSLSTAGDCDPLSRPTPSKVFSRNFCRRKCNIL